MLPDSWVPSKPRAHVVDHWCLIFSPELLQYPRAWLFWREELPAWQRWWLLTVALTAEFAWPLTPLPLLLVVGVWFVCLAARRKVSAAVASAA